MPQFTARNYITATHKSTMAKGIVKAETVPSILTSGMATVALHKHDALNTIGAAKLFTSAAGGITKTFDDQHSGQRRFCTGYRYPNPNPS